MSQENLFCVGHVNLAKGLRGGENQTILLVKQLAVMGVRQTLIIRADSPLKQAAGQIPNLKLILLRKPYWLSILLKVDADLMHAHEAKAAQWVYLKTRWSKQPYILTRRILKAPKNNFFTNLVYRNASAVVAVSQAVAQSLLSRFGNPNLPVIPDMCSDYKINRKTLLELQHKYANKFVLGHIGALVNRDKGQQFLIEAAKHLKEQAPKIHILLLGTGPDHAYLQGLAQGLDNVEFLGFQTDIGTYLSLLDLFVFPSLQEGLGSILLDAMQAAKPVIASKVGGIPDIVQHEYNGLLVAAGDATALTEAILRIYHDAELYARLASQASESAKGYQADCIAAHYYSLYKQVLADIDSKKQTLP